MQKPNRTSLDEYSEYLSKIGSSPEDEENDNDDIDRYSENDDFGEDYDDYSPYESESDRLRDEYGEDGFEAGDNFFPESWSPE